MTKEIKKIALFSAYYPPHLGGVELFTKNLSEALGRKGVKVTVITSSSKDAKTDIDAGSKPCVVALPSLSIMGDRFPLILPSPHFFALRKQIEKEQFDGIVVNTRYYPISLLGCREAAKHGTSAVLIDHSSGPISSENNPLGTLMRQYESAMTKIIARQNPRFCSVSQRGLQWLQSINLPVSTVIPNSIDAEKYRHLSSEKNWRMALDLDEGTFLVTYAGRLIPEKGLPKLLQAMDEVNKSNKKIVLAIAGDGPLVADLQKNSSPHIRYVERLNQSDLSALLGASDCFCFPTEYPEGLPTVLLEAAAQNCAIIVSDCAGAREIIKDSSMGIVLTDVSSKAIADSILKLASDRVETRSMGLKVREHVERTFSWDATADKLLRFISASLNESF